jgi:hypothetical protein
MRDGKGGLPPLAKVMANHAGVVPLTRTGDYSDVMVIDAEGRKIPWAEVSHIDDAQMRALMQDIDDRLYTFHMRIDDPEFQAWIDHWAAIVKKWDDPELSQPIAEP